MKKITVAVDGPAGSGKSSVSRQVAARLGITYIDSGAIYRAITWFFLEKYGDIDSETPFDKGIKGLDIRQEYYSDRTTKTFVNGLDVSKLIRSEEVVKSIQWVSSDKAVRDFVTTLLREWAGEKSIIMDGRDIGSVVFPNADLKIYLDASVETRAKRRYDEYVGTGKNVDLKAIKKQIIQRDSQDTAREFGALKRCEDAVFVDTSDMTQDQVVNKLTELIENQDSA
ncbi:MAG: (d)CMP kinase [Spirochaetes bacterium]|nr:(d)CMP kinase [Spirochaetota bacterium]MBN2770453.1 (d)CMP kinase [Spirochaetota bacterium]